MNGKDYVALVELRTRDGLVASVGERCDRVPVQSLEWLLHCKRIAALPAAEKKAAKTSKKEEAK